LAVCVLP
jgi:hypothetical protein